MKKTIIAGITVGIILTAFLIVFTYAKAMYSTKYRTYQHEERRGSNPNLGAESVPEDGILDKSDFVSHLPLIILDMNGKEPQNIFKMVGESQARDYIDKNNTEEWIDCKLSIIDNENYQNTLISEPALVNKGIIKMRGASSRSFKKKQYKLKLLDENKQELELPLLGMDADEDWVLSNSILDATQIRNYTAYNLGGHMMPFTPECRFCEVIIKDGEKYKYQGLYLLTEAIKQGKGHIEISDYKKNQKRPSMVLVRDREDYTKPTLSTWASKNQLTYGWFTFKYPKELSAEFIKVVEDEISLIEKTLYSENRREFLKYDRYLDIDSFVDYFVINEYFMNYDSGNNSTYYYQDPSRKLSMGPLWDYDNCWDNYKPIVGGDEYMVMPERPWFERLVTDQIFVDKAVRRYSQLRKNILSEKNVEHFIDSTVYFLGNAVKRDRSRWRKVYEQEHMLAYAKEGKGYFIDRNRMTYEEEITRLKDMERGHGRWLDLYMDDYLSEFIKGKADERLQDAYIGLALTCILCFIASIIMLGRRINS